jgi:hypothetical protein
VVFVDSRSRLHQSWGINLSSTGEHLQVDVLISFDLACGQVL